MKVVIAHGGNIGFKGGGTNRVLNFASALAKAGYEVTLVVPKPIGEIPSEIQNLVDIFTVPIKPRSVWDQIIRATLISRKAKKIAEKERAILQVEHSTLGGIAATLGCSGYVLDVHDLEFDGSLYKSIPLSSRIVKYLEKKAVSKASKIVVVSELMKEFIVNNWHVPEEKISVIPNGCYVEKVKKFTNFSCEEEGLLSFIGVFTHNVDYDKVIKLAKFKNLRVCMIGDGPMRSNFLKTLRKKGIKNITAPGFLPDDEAYRMLARAQVCIFPLKNTFHTKVAMHIKTLDYAALGKAIATDRDGTARIFEKHNAALVSDPANPNEFLENVQKLLKDDSLRKTLGENARKLVQDFSWEKQSEKLVKIYEQLQSS